MVVARTRSGGIFITGGTGLLGLHWAQACKTSWQVAVATNRRVNVPSGITAWQVDLSNPAALDEALHVSNADLVVHTAGLTSVERCEAEPERAEHENTFLAEKVAQAAARRGSRLIHISTDHLFSGDADLYSENDPVEPVNTYARTKAAAEELVLKACPEALVLRTNFYGWGPSYRPSFSDWILKKLAAGDSIPLFSDVHYTPVLIAPLIKAALNLVEKGASGIVHATGDDVLTKLAFGQAVARQFGYSDISMTSSKLSAQKDLVRRPVVMALSNARLRHLLGYGMGTLAEQLEQLKTEAAQQPIKEIRAL